MAMDNNSTAQDTESKEKKHTTRNILIIGGIIIVVVILLLLRSCGGANTPVETDPHSVNPGNGVVSTEDLEHMTPEEIQAMLNEQAAKGYITISMNPRPVFETGASEGSLMIANSAHIYKLVMDGKTVSSTEDFENPEFEIAYDGHTFTLDAKALDGDEDSFTSNPLDGGDATLVFNKDGSYEYRTGSGSKSGSYIVSYEMGNYYDQVVEIYTLKDGEPDQLIYTSPVIPVGAYVHYDTLDVELDAGEYPCVACFYLVDESVNIIGQGNAEILITIEK